MEQLAIFGIVMIVVIATILQHVFNFLVRNGDDDALKLAFITMIASMVLYFISFMMVVKYF